jgi:hypothetical protein
VLFYLDHIQNKLTYLICRRSIPLLDGFAEQLVCCGRHLQSAQPQSAFGAQIAVSAAVWLVGAVHPVQSLEAHSACRADFDIPSTRHCLDFSLASTYAQHNQFLALAHALRLPHSHVVDRASIQVASVLHTYR